MVKIDYRDVLNKSEMLIFKKNKKKYNPMANKA